MGGKTLRETATFAGMVAAKQGWVLNPDGGFTDGLLDGLTVNWNRYGYYLCPCRDTEGSREADARMVCPCSYSHTDVEEQGHCYCALYLSPDFASLGKVPGSIRDRRYAKEGE